MPERTDHNEAMRLADEVRAVADRLQYTPGGFYGVETVGPLNQAAALLRQLSAERDQLRAEVERLKPNAERYEWLRDPENVEGYSIFNRYECMLSAEALDAAIDAARTTHKETE